MNIAVVTTFPNDMFNVYAKRMLESFVENWPKEVPILVQLDDNSLAGEVHGILRDPDGINSIWSKEHREFVERNNGRDDPQDYRKQAVRFCHKVFAIKAAFESVAKAKIEGMVDVPRYLVWLDADVITTRKITVDDIAKCLPKEGDAVSYLGRKDWPHSECGWLAFDLENGGDKIIDLVHLEYTSDTVFTRQQWDDSWIFDIHIKANKSTNLTPTAIGMDVWPQSPMASWSRHYKGPIAKNELSKGVIRKEGRMQPLKVLTENSIPDDSIQKNILENQTLIKKWIMPCIETDEEIVMVSAGPMLISEDLQVEVDARRRIVAVKHALEPLKEAGIKPWACILLDPRDHVAGFVENPDKDVIWFVASQVTPSATRSLLAAGCKVIGYHASVGAAEAKYTAQQPYSIIDGGSATATRGMFLMDRLGFRKFRLYGYDLCLPYKPDLKEKDDKGQPKYFEIEMNYQMPFYKSSRWFWSKGELLAQADEFRQILEMNRWQINAFGQGIVPFLTNVKRVNDLRRDSKISKMAVIKPVHYEELLGCKSKILLSPKPHKMQPKILRKRIRASNS